MSHIGFIDATVGGIQIPQVEGPTGVGGFDQDLQWKVLAYLCLNLTDNGLCQVDYENLYIYL